MKNLRLLQISVIALGLAFTTALTAPASAANAKIKAAQEMLVKLGYDPGEPDGAWGGKSRDALNAFQKEQGFKNTRRLGKGTLLALELISNGAEKSALLMAEKAGNTVVLDAGFRVYYAPNGEKLLRLTNGKIIKAKWHKKDDGTYCEYVFSIKKESCGDKWAAGLITYKLDGKWTVFEKTGKKKWGMRVVEGDHLKP